MKKMEYKDREEMKKVGYQCNIPDLVIYSHWVRSRMSANDDRHPDYAEYREAYLSGGMKWLTEGKSYVDMQQYLRDNPDRKEEKRIREQTYINKIEKLKENIKELKEQNKDLKEELKSEERTLRDVRKIAYIKQQKIDKLENDIQERNVFLTGLGVEVDKVFKK